jgi:hypothetical protein
MKKNGEGRRTVGAFVFLTLILVTRARKKNFQSKFKIIMYDKICHY